MVRQRILERRLTRDSGLWAVEDHGSGGGRCLVGKPQIPGGVEVGIVEGSANKETAVVTPYSGQVP